MLVPLNGNIDLSSLDHFHLKNCVTITVQTNKCLGIDREDRS